MHGETSGAADKIEHDHSGDTNRIQYHEPDRVHARCINPHLTPPMPHSSATFSPCRTYRYSLTRIWDADAPVCAFVLLNPSTADETANDPTITRCIGFARRWGFGSLLAVNIFALRSTDPKGLRRIDDPVGPGNDRAIRRVIKSADLVVAAWGGHGKYLDRGRRVLTMLPDDAVCLGINRDGAPKHPLYIPGDTEPIALPCAPQTNPI